MAENCLHELVRSPSNSPAHMSAFAKPSSPRPGPSILLNPYCRSPDGLRVQKPNSKFAQLSGVLKALIFNPPSGDLPSPGLRDPETNTFLSRDHSPTSSSHIGKHDSKAGELSPLSIRSPTTPIRSPVIKFAPLPQINNRIKRANSIPVGVSSRAMMLQCARESMITSTPKPGANILSSSLPTRQRPEWAVECSVIPDLHPSAPNSSSRPNGPRRKRQGRKERERRRRVEELSGLEGFDVCRNRNSSSGSSASGSSAHSGSIFEDDVERRGSASSAGKTSVASALSDKADDSEVASHED